MLQETIVLKAIFIRQVSNGLFLQFSLSLKQDAVYLRPKSDLRIQEYSVSGNKGMVLFRI